MNKAVDRIDEIFWEAANLAPGEERDAYLARACGQDRAVRQRVDRLLQVQPKVEGFLERPFAGPAQAATVDEAPATEAPGTVLGSYKLLEQIGEGGMGTVYVAAQTEPVRRRVALKIMKPGLDSKQALARFEAERQALALMDHPHIAKVFDAGMSAAGRPYFVMELVKGVSLTNYCDNHRLTTRQRLELFMDVCSAVQHAHHKGVIHRDLKPSNLLVTVHDVTPVVKVIDFGIAKATGHLLTDKTIYTGFAQMVGTPLYMSPEQAGLSGLDVDTRSDIYSLGVLLYELLTGTTPFDGETLKKAGYDEMRRIIREDEPPKPSTRLSTLAEAALSTVCERRAVEPRKLGRQVRGELDWIVMKALEKDRNRRYDTANGFAADVGRYLSDEPVQACPPTRLYRFRKFLRRNKAALAMATTVGVMLLVTVVLLGTSNLLITHERDLKDAALKQEQVSLRAKDEALVAAEAQRNRAQQNFNNACYAINSMLTGLATTQLTRDAKMESMRREVLRKALELYQAFLKPDATDLTSREETAYAYLQLISVYNLLGQSDAADEAGRQAQERYEKLTADFPTDQTYWNRLALTHHVRGDRLGRTFGRQQEAVVHLGQAIALWKKLRTEFPSEPSYQNSFAESCVNLGYYLWSAFGKSDEAEQLLRQGVESRQKLVAQFPSDLEYQRTLAADCASWGIVLLSLKRLPETEQALRAALKTLDGLSASPNGGDNRALLARVLGILGGVLGQTSRLEEAEACSRRALGLLESQAADYPLKPEMRQNLASAYCGGGAAFEAKGQREEAEKSYRRALAMQEKLLADFPDLHDVRGQLANTLFRLAKLLGTSGRGPEAAQHYQRILKLTPDSMNAGNNLAWYLATCPDPQYRDAKRAVELATKSVEMAPQQGGFWNTLGVAQYRSGKWHDAIVALTKSRELLKGRFDSFNFFFLAMARWQLGDKEQARKEYEQAVQWMDKNAARDEELRCFRVEAAALLGLSDPPKKVDVPEKKKDSPSKK